MKKDLKVKVRQPNFSAAMARTNLSQGEIASLIGVAEGWYSQMFRGLVGISPKSRRRVIELLEERGIPAEFDDLFLLEGVTTGTSKSTAFTS
jgi:transcriptional regulator with XRE-family HTH domain